MPVVAERLRRAPTLLRGLETLCAIVRRDCTGISCWLSGHGEFMRLNLSKPFGREVPGHHPSEWRGIGGLVDSVRIFTGPDWVPPEIASRSLEPPPTLAYEVFPNARILVRQPLTWIAVPQPMLSLPPTPGLRPPAPDEAASPEPIPDFLDALRMSLEPYLGGTYPRIELAAEIAGTSVRTLQRKLAEAGLSYRTLLDEARFAVAARALVDSDATSTDVGYSCGYTDPSNFARAFRRFAGVSPSDYRLQHRCAS
jgi:AraC-like DNA-binding protein